MSAVLTPDTTTPAPARVPALRVTQRRVLLSEFTKFRSLRSTMSVSYTHLTLPTICSV